MIVTKPAVLPGIADDVREGLARSPKALPPRLFYDAEGSALFEQITRLPEYYLTRTETEILEAHAEEMAALVGPQGTLVELGAGTAKKTQILVRALLRRQLQVRYIPIDISQVALEQAKRSLELESDFVKVSPRVGALEDLAFLQEVAPPRLVLYIGSSIGNLEEDEAVHLLRSIRENSSAGDHLLLGADLAKDPRVLLPAYNDAQGVTARFNKNVLARINRELDGEFDLQSFRHVAEWNPDASRIEMYLVSERAQAVRIAALGRTFRFSPQERIHTENSYKYTSESIRGILEAGGFQLRRTWTDPQGWYALHLAERA